jgi:hypothetical protein
MKASLWWVGSCRTNRASPSDSSREQPVHGSTRLLRYVRGEDGGRPRPAHRGVARRFQRADVAEDLLRHVERELGRRVAYRAAAGVGGARARRGGHAAVGRLHQEEKRAGAALSDRIRATTASGRRKLSPRLCRVVARWMKQGSRCAGQVVQAEGGEDASVLFLLDHLVGGGCIYVLNNDTAT